MNMNTEYGKASLVDGFVKDDQVNPLQNKTTYFTTPAKNNGVGFEGNLTPILKQDFMIEAVVNMENTSTVNYPGVFIGTIRGYHRGNMQIYGGGNSNELGWVLFGNNDSVESVENSILVGKTIPKNKLFHIVIGRSRVNAFALVNGVFYRVTQTEVLEISNKLTIANAKKFVQLRKFNFADEDYAQKLWNGGRWWEMSVEREYKLSEIISLLPSNPVQFENSIIENGIYKLNVPFKEIYQAVIGRDSDNIFILKYKYFTSVPDIYTRSAFRGVGSDLTKIDKINEWNEVISIFRTNFNNDMVYIAFSNKYGSPITDNDVNNIYLVKDIELKSANIQDEFLPQSFNSTCAINTAGGENLIAKNPQQIEFSTQAPYCNETIIEAKAPDIAPDMDGQMWINTSNNIKYIGLETKAVSDWKQMK